MTLKPKLVSIVILALTAGVAAGVGIDLCDSSHDFGKSKSGCKRVLKSPSPSTPAQLLTLVNTEDKKQAYGPLCTGPNGLCCTDICRAAPGNTSYWDQAGGPKRCNEPGDPNCYIYTTCVRRTYNNTSTCSLSGYVGDISASKWCCN